MALKGGAWSTLHPKSDFLSKHPSGPGPQHVGRVLRVGPFQRAAGTPEKACVPRRASCPLFIPRTPSGPVWPARPGLASAPRTPHPALPASPRPLTPTCPCGRWRLHGWGAVRGHWGRLSRWCVEGAGDGTGCPGGPCAAGEMPRPCSSAMTSKRGLVSGLSQETAPGALLGSQAPAPRPLPGTLSGPPAPLRAGKGKGAALRLPPHPVCGVPVRPPVRPRRASPTVSQRLLVFAATCLHRSGGGAGWTGALWAVHAHLWLLTGAPWLAEWGTSAPQMSPLPHLELPQPCRPQTRAGQPPSHALGTLLGDPEMVNTPWRLGWGRGCTPLGEGRRPDARCWPAPTRPPRPRPRVLVWSPTH